MRRLAFLSLWCLCGCVPAAQDRLPDCEELAREQPDCMNDDAVDDCLEANELCAESGEVEVGESCPLTFTCVAVGNA